MSCRSCLVSLVSITALTLPLAAQESLSLEQAVRIGLRSNPAIEAARAGVREAAAGERIAGAGHRPSISFVESYLRSNNPVFVFGSLLNQREFGAGNFEIDSLNNPDSLQNFQSTLQVEQTLFDFRRTRHALREARLLSDLSAEEIRSREADVILGVVRRRSVWR